MTRNTPIDAILSVEENTCATWESAVSNCEHRAWKHLRYQTMLLEGGIFDNYLKTTTNDFFLVYIYDELSSLCKKKRVVQAKEEKYSISYAIKKKDEKVLQRKNWCMRIFCAIECKLIGFQQTFVLSCAAQPT